MASYPTYSPRRVRHAQREARSPRSTTTPTAAQSTGPSRASIRRAPPSSRSRPRPRSSWASSPPGEQLESPSDDHALQADASATSEEQLARRHHAADGAARSPATPTSTRWPTASVRRRTRRSDVYPLQDEARELRPGHEDRHRPAVRASPPASCPTRPGSRSIFAGPAVHRLPAQLAGRRHDPARRGPGLPAGDAAADGRRPTAPSPTAAPCARPPSAREVRDPNGRVVQQLSKGRPDPAARHQPGRPRRDPPGPLRGRQRPRRHLHRRVRPSCPTTTRWPARPAPPSRATAARTTPGSSGYAPYDDPEHRRGGRHRARRHRRQRGRSGRLLAPWRAYLKFDADLCGEPTVASR